MDCYYCSTENIKYYCQNTVKGICNIYLCNKCYNCLPNNRCYICNGYLAPLNTEVDFEEYPDDIPDSILDDIPDDIEEDGEVIVCC